MPNAMRATTRIAPLLGMLACLSCAAPPAALPDATSSVVALASGNVLFTMPSGKPKAVVIMLAGSDGAIGIRSDGSIQNGGNFLIRTRPRWVAAGMGYVAVDNAAGDARVGPANQQSIAETVKLVRQRTDAPIWLMGTSAGAPAALDGAAALPPGAIAGVVVSSPVTLAGPRETVFDAPLDRITGPVLIQVHRNDACDITPPDKAPALKAALIRARAVDIQPFQGGSAPRSRPCQAASAHGFLGIEDEVVGAAVMWMASH